MKVGTNGNMLSKYADTNMLRKIWKNTIHNLRHWVEFEGEHKAHIKKWLFAVLLSVAFNALVSAWYRIHVQSLVLDQILLIPTTDMLLKVTVEKIQLCKGVFK